MFNAQNRIRQLMAERGWTIYRLAQESGLSQTTISNIFKRNNQPSLPTVNAICDACGITLAQFFTENDTANSAHLESVLDEKVDVWYNEGNDEISERTQYGEDPVYLSRQYLPQPHGRVRDEGLGTEGWAGIAISYRISGYQSGGDWQPGLSSGTA